MKFVNTVCDFIVTLCAGTGKALVGLLVIIGVLVVALIGGAEAIKGLAGLAALIVIGKLIYKFYKENRAQ